MKTESQQKKVEKYVTDDLVSRRTQAHIHTSKQSSQQEQDRTNLFIKHIHLCTQTANNGGVYYKGS